MLSSTFKLVQKQPELRLHFENSYKESLCDFNFEQYLSNNCVITLSKKVEALKSACISTRDYAGRLLDSAPDKSSANNILAIYYQVWTQSFSATLAQITKSTVKAVEKPAAKVKDDAETRKLPMIPPEWKDDVQSGLEKLANTSCRPIYPKLCSRDKCFACVQLLYDLPVSKCSVDCQHEKIAHDVFPHLSRKFSDRLKPHHRMVPVQVRETYRPHTYHNPMWRRDLPQQFDTDIKELTQDVDRMELESTTSTFKSADREVTQTLGIDEVDPQASIEYLAENVAEYSTPTESAASKPSPKRELSSAVLSKGKKVKAGKASTVKMATRSSLLKSA